MNPALALAMGSGGAVATYVDDVFSAYTYDGTGTTKTITNGIDLAGQGGMVWCKSRSTFSYAHGIYDTARGAGEMLSSNTTAAEVSNTGITAFNSNGFTMGSSAIYTNDTAPYISWAFRKAPKFFDVVTWTGNSTAGRQIAHALGTTPGMIIVKGTSAGTAGFNWKVWHRSLPSSAYNLALNTTGAQTSDNGIWNSTAPTSSVFTVGADTSVNASGETYVAYVFAHDATTNGLIQCGSFTTDASGNASVTLGWEPQFLLYKQTSSTGAWLMHDSARGMTSNVTTGSAYLFPHLSNAEATPFPCSISATGFSVVGLSISTTFIYMAIRRSNKPPTTGTQVYNAVARTGTGAAATVTGVGFAPDLAITCRRSDRTGTSTPFFDRLRGTANYLIASSTNAEGVASDALLSFNMNGMNLDTDATIGFINSSSTSYANWLFRRAVGVFDIVCDVGSGGVKTVNHGLGVTPELFIRKSRDSAVNWAVYSVAVGATSALYLNSTGGIVTSTSLFNDTAPSSTVFTVGTAGTTNSTGDNYVTYLFATKAGISKVGSYTGNGTSINIDCGFTAGARFVLIKRTDATGDWYVWDTVRGIVAGNDPHLSLNTVSAEVTTNDTIDPLSAGFTVNQVAATNVNVNAATYIFLAFA